MRIHRILYFILIISLFAASSCRKNAAINNTNGGKFGYSDSVFYLKSSSYKVLPLSQKIGTYTAFPGNLDINSATGEITVADKGNDGESLAGLMYKIKFTSASSNETDSVYIRVAGINYPDKFYFLAQNDSILYPVYNANPGQVMPGNFNISNDNKLAIDPVNGQINLKETIRRGFFNDLSPNTKWKQTTIRYTTNDLSAGIVNSLDVILYYYDSYSEVPSNVSGLMQAHQRMTLGFNQASIPSSTAPVENNLSSDLSLFKPRPPCVIIVGN